MDKQHFGSVAKTAALGAVLALTAACNGGGGSSTPPPSPLGLACAAVFTNTTYVDYIADNSDAEASNMEAALLDAGVGEVRTFTGISASAITTATTGCGTLIIPEQENGVLSGDLTPEANTAIDDFVRGGGNLIVAASNSNSGAADLVNGVFGWATTETPVGASITLDDNDAPGTAFEGGTTVGGTTLTSPSATEAFTAADLPMGARSIYTDANGNAVVAMMQVEAGTVTLLGWDYFNAQPVGTVDDGWIEVLLQAVLADALEMQIPLTDVAVADVEAKGWTTCHTENYDSNGTVIADLVSGRDAPCKGAELMLACRLPGSPDLTVAARATVAEMTVDTGANAGVTHAVGGVSWYYNPDWSWGFASLGDPVNKNSCDIETTGKDNQRMCWHTGSGEITSGWSCGTTKWEYGTGLERVFLAR